MISLRTIVDVYARHIDSLNAEAPQMERLTRKSNRFSVKVLPEE